MYVRRQLAYAWFLHFNLVRYKVLMLTCMMHSLDLKKGNDIIAIYGLCRTKTRLEGHNGVNR